ncbi:MAG: 50S ribosomal protein L11 methyltransferase [Candidatus Doudnabacteria bacterium]|nr:50S ribosomal protein L11 methyltransferase [Candidatus Doudnabacteria bacterium]
MVLNIILLLIILLVAYYLGIFRGAPFVPTQRKNLEKMIELAEIKRGEKLADLGSGDGRILIAAVRAGAIAHGYEINPLLIWYSRYKIKKAGLSDKAFVHWKNFWLENFRQYDVVTVFGITGIMERLESKLLTELKPGSRVVSNIFKFPNWEGKKMEGVTVYRVEK